MKLKRANFTVSFSAYGVYSNPIIVPIFYITALEGHRNYDFRGYARHELASFEGSLIDKWCSYLNMCLSLSATTDVAICTDVYFAITSTCCLLLLPCGDVPK